METKIDINKTTEHLVLQEEAARVKALLDIKNLLTDLNESLVELKKEKENYHTKISECRGLCHEIRKMMDAT